MLADQVLSVSISVIIPVHNGEKYLAEAIQTVLDQSLGAQEIVVIDDGSTDHSGAIAAQFSAPVRVLRQERGGTAAARNTGLAAATGSFIAFLDADDLWPKDRLALQVRHLLPDSVCFGAVGKMKTFVEEDAPAWVADRLAERLALEPVGHITSALIRRDAFDSVGPFDETLRLGEALDWWQRARESGGQFVEIDEVVTCRRLHGGNKTLQERRQYRDYTRVLHKALQRRRT